MNVGRESDIIVFFNVIFLLMMKPFLHCVAATRTGYLYVSGLMLQQLHGTIKEPEVELAFAVKLRVLFLSIHEHQFKLQLFSA